MMAPETLIFWIAVACVLIILVLAVIVSIIDRKKDKFISVGRRRNTHRGKVWDFYARVYDPRRRRRWERITEDVTKIRKDEHNMRNYEIIVGDWCFCPCPEQPHLICRCPVSNFDLSNDTQLN